MKRSNKIISLEYLQNLVKKQEEKEAKEKSIKYVDGDTSKVVQIVQKCT
jgi:hypothetical protein